MQHQVAKIKSTLGFESHSATASSLPLAKSNQPQFLRPLNGDGDNPCGALCLLAFLLAAPPGPVGPSVLVRGVLPSHPSKSRNCHHWPRDVCHCPQLAPFAGGWGGDAASKLIIQNKAHTEYITRAISDTNASHLSNPHKNPHKSPYSPCATDEDKAQRD